MIVIRPDQVKFGSVYWSGVVRVSLDRLSARTIEEWGGDGPHAEFVDVARQRVVIRVVQEIEGDDLRSPIPGEQEQFLMIVSPSGSDASKTRVRCDAVIESVQSKASDFGASRRVTLIAVSGDGAVDPIEVSPVS